MNYKYKLNKYHENFKDFILNIKDYFENIKENIHKARNELKIVEYKGTKTVVKSFKKPHIINRLVYTFFRDSKAKKSYDYSIRIGQFTPQPIGYIEFYESGLISSSYFISEMFEYDFTIREPLLDRNFPDKEEVLKAFARFTFDLHEHHIFHQDYSPGNILIKKNGSEYIFKVVDINRMQFLPLDIDQRLKNFSKLWMKDEDLKTVAKEYASLINIHEVDAEAKALRYSHAHKARINLKKRLKGIEVVD